jgi:hypothetical protein
VKRKQEAKQIQALTDEEKARILQNNGNAKRNKYKQMTIEDKVRILQK